MSATCPKCGQTFRGTVGKHGQKCGVTAEQMFWMRVDKSGGPDACWPWTAARKPMGYGHFVWKEKHYNAHRYSWALANGPIPTGMHVLHRCDNQPCVNPKHLFIGTHQDNMIDMHVKGRRVKQQKLSVAKVREIRALKGSKTAQELAGIYGCSDRQIYTVWRNAQWKFVQ
jgi:hypothetical protein